MTTRSSNTGPTWAALQERPPASPDSAERPADIASPEEPTHGEIAARAYRLYLNRGRTDGHDLDDWLEAEQQLRGAEG